MTSTCSSRYIHSAIRRALAASTYPVNTILVAGAMSEATTSTSGSRRLVPCSNPATKRLDETRALVRADVPDPAGLCLERRRRAREECRLPRLAKFHIDSVRLFTVSLEESRNTHVESGWSRWSPGTMDVRGSQPGAEHDVGPRQGPRTSAGDIQVRGFGDHDRVQLVVVRAAFSTPLRDELVESCPGHGGIPRATAMRPRWPSSAARLGRRRCRRAPRSRPATSRAAGAERPRSRWLLGTPARACTVSAPRAVRRIDVGVSSVARQLQLAGSRPSVRSHRGGTRKGGSRYRARMLPTVASRHTKRALHGEVLTAFVDPIAESSHPSSSASCATSTVGRARRRVAVQGEKRGSV